MEILKELKNINISQNLLNNINKSYDSKIKKWIKRYFN